MTAVKRTGIAALATCALAVAGALALPTAASAAPVDVVIDGVTYTADDADIAAGATATDFDFSTSSVEIPDTVNIGGVTYNVRTIADDVFYVTGTPGPLTSVVIGDNVTDIGSETFAYNSISSLTLGQSVSVIEYGAFAGNELTHVQIPASVTTLGKSAFGSNSELGSATFNGPAPQVYEWDDDQTVWRGTFSHAADDFVISFPEQYGEPNTPGGYTAPEWEGYASEAIPEEDPADWVSITKTVDASFMRDYDWSLEKSGVLGDVTVGDDSAEADIDYTVTATPEGYVDRSYLLSGEITVTNEYVEPVDVTVTDVPSIGIDATCAVVTPGGDPAIDVALGASSTRVFEYSCDVSGTPQDGTNTATVSWINGEASVTEDVEFAERTVHAETVTVMDDLGFPDDSSMYTEIGEARWNSDHVPWEFTYTVTQSGLPIGKCTQVVNTTWLREADSVTAEATVEVCPEAADIPQSEETDADPEAAPRTDDSADVLPRTGADAGGLTLAAVLLVLAGGAAMTIGRVRRRS